jgi:uncharacterized protein YkwD
MKRRIGVAGLVLALMALTLTAMVSLAAPASAASPTDEQGFVDKINQERTSRSLRPLIFDLKIRDVARAWSDKMAATGNFVHNPDYSKQIPAGWTRAAENIAWGSGTNATVAVLHKALMDSSGHRANILGDFTRVGVGVTVSGGRMWVTQNFGKYPNDPVPGSTPTTTTTTTAAPTSTTTAPPSSITLTVTKGTYDSGTKSKATLKWSGASGSNVDAYRNGTRVTTTANDGAWTHKIGVKVAAGTVYGYKVCRAGTTTCSPTVSVTF